MAEPQRIGVVSSTASSPTTTEQFALNLDQSQAVRRFDMVTVPLADGSRTHGLVMEIANPTETPSHLANHMNTELGTLEEEMNSKIYQVNTASCAVLSNSAGHDMPVPHGQAVFLASSEGISEALGIDRRVAETPENMIAAGMIGLSNNVIGRVLLDVLFLLGPEGAHINASGVSGLATKTSYLLFLLQAILQHERRVGTQQTAVIILNSKKGDLLRIHQPAEALTVEDRAAWVALDLEPLPFQDARYFLPRGARGRANSFQPVPRPHSLYAYTLEGAAPYLHLLFGHITNESGTIESTIAEVREILLDAEDREHDMINTWERLMTFLRDQSKDWRSIKPVSLRMVRRHLRRLVGTGNENLFISSLAEGRTPEETEQLPSEILSGLRPGDVYVFDIANLRDHERALVVGSLLHAINDVKTDPARMQAFPPRVILYLDELGKYAPAGERSPIVDQFVEIAERGRSSGEILFSAQQSRSAVNSRIIGTIGTSAIGMTGAAELATPGYGSVPHEIKSTITRLHKGEMVLIHPVFRFPVKIKFPKPAWRQS